MKNPIGLPEVDPQNRIGQVQLPRAGGEGEGLLLALCQVGGNGAGSDR